MSGTPSQKSRAKSETVSFRVEGRIRFLLEEEAKKTGVSLNALVSQIFLRYVMWGRYAGRLKLIPVSKDLLRDLFRSLDKERIGDIAKGLAETSGSEHILFLYQEVNPRTLLEFLNTWSSHFDAYEHRTDGKVHFYTIHHDVNRNFSLLLKEYIASLVQSAITRPVKFAAMSPNAITFSFEE